MLPFVESPRGVRMPRILYGTAWKKAETPRLVEAALRRGFRGVDTACQPKHYDEAGVGVGVAAALTRGLQREELYLQTKYTPVTGQDPERIPYDPSAVLATQVRQSCAASLNHLRVARIDALVLHSPLDTLERTFEAWRAMESLVDDGSVVELGISNCDFATLQALWQRARIKPFIVQNRLYAKTGFDDALRRWCTRHGIVYQSFWTLTANPGLLADARVVAEAARLGVTVQQLFFRALTQMDVVPLTGTTSEAHMVEDLAIFDFELDAPALRMVAELLR